MVGPTGSGKSQFVAELIRRRHELFSVPVNKIVWVYADYQPLFRELQREEPGITFVNSIQNLKSVVERDSILVLDDQFQALNKAQDCQIIKDFYLIHSHHMCVSTIGIFQTAYHRSMREISLNSQLLILFDFSRDRSIITNLARQIFPGNTKFLQSAYEHCVKKDWGYIVMDLHPRHKRYCWVRSSIFPSKDCVVFIP